MTLTTKKFSELIKIKTNTQPFVSIYIPTFRAGQAPEDRIRFKNALSDAEQKLTEGKAFAKGNLDKKAAKKLLSPAYDLLKNDDFWLHLSDGLAVFINEQVFEYFIVPEHFNSFVYVGQHFYLRHLLPLITEKQHFFLLALSQGEVRFFECHKNYITPVIIKDLVPENIEEVFIDQDANLQVHAGGANGNGIYHGQGAGKDQKNTDLKKYFRQIDKGLMEMLHDEDAPVLIAAVDYLVPIYRDISNYQNIMDFHISGNPEDNDPVLLHEKSMVLMKEVFQEKQREKKENFAPLLAQNKAALSILQVVAAAQEGRIDTLFVDKDKPVVWGHHPSPEDHSVGLSEEQSPSDTCLLNYAALQTWQNGGTVYNVSKKAFPNMVSYVNAIYRY